MCIRRCLFDTNIVPVTGRVVAQRGGRGIVLLFHDRALEGDEWSVARPGRTLPRERLGTDCTGDWVGSRAGLDGRKILPHRNSIPGPSSP